MSCKAGQRGKLKSPDFTAPRSFSTASPPPLHYPGLLFNAPTLARLLPYLAKRQFPTLTAPTPPLIRAPPTSRRCGEAGGARLARRLRANFARGSFRSERGAAAFPGCVCVLAPLRLRTATSGRSGGSQGGCRRCGPPEASNKNRGLAGDAGAPLLGEGV